MLGESFDFSKPTEHLASSHNKICVIMENDKPKNKGRI